MALIIFWSQLAEEKLEDIFEYYKTTASLRIAQNLINGLVDQTLLLINNPFIGQKEELLADRSEDFRYLVYKNYKIIYWLNKAKSRVEIANVFDSRQNPIKLQKTK